MKSLQRMQNDFARILTTPGKISAEDSRFIFDQIYDLYTDPSRHYHNMMHIIDLWEQADDLQWGFEDPDAVKMAIILHDAIFHFKDMPESNEELSANLAEQTLYQAGHDRKFIKRVGDLIRMTEKHETFENGDHDAELFLDMDMMSFAQPHNIFLHNAVNVAKETIQGYGVEECRKKMLGFMNSLLTKQHFFLSDTYQEKHGERAIKNIKWAIENFDVITDHAVSPQTPSPWSPPIRIIK